MKELRQSSIKSCQLQNISGMGGRELPLETKTVFFKFRLLLKRILSTKTKRTIKKFIKEHPFLLFSHSQGLNENLSDKRMIAETILKAGDRVRIRSKEEIYATLDMWKENKGCGFMKEMEQYCGTSQVVLKPVERFLDERDYKMKSTRGIVILEGLNCQGIEGYGRCDRNCFYFWRVEWLEKE